MNFDWDRYWWLVIILAALAVPIVNAVFQPWRDFLRYRRQKDAIEALKVYAAQNRDPPPEVLDALRGRWLWRSAGATARQAARAATATAAEAVYGPTTSGIGAGTAGSGGWRSAWPASRGDDGTGRCSPPR